MLYIVATPIGNLGDITYRAVEILQSVDFILCEDTRHSVPLLKKYGISKPLYSYHKFNEKESVENIKERLLKGESAALISDAGMPGISDPGAVLIKEAISEGIDYTVIPGPCAAVNALVLSGLNTDKFLFFGFLPEKSSKKEEELKKLSDCEYTLIFYISPHSAEKDISVLYKFLGNRKAVVLREMTKIFEERVEFNLKDGYPGELRGEFVLAVEGAAGTFDFTDLTVEEHINAYVSAGYSLMDAVKKTARDRGVAKNEIYKHTLKKS